LTTRRATLARKIARGERERGARDRLFETALREKKKKKKKKKRTLKITPARLSYYASAIARRDGTFQALAIHRLIRFRKIFSKITSDPGQNRSENSA